MIDFLIEKSKLNKNIFKKLFVYIYCFPIVVICIIFKPNDFKGFALERRINHKLIKYNKKNKKQYKLFWNLMIEQNSYTHQII